MSRAKRKMKLIIIKYPETLRFPERETAGSRRNRTKNSNTKPGKKTSDYEEIKAFRTWRRDYKSLIVEAISVIAQIDLQLVEVDNYPRNKLSQ